MIMIIIKRYANRKLYDTVAKKYITLEGISQLVLDGNNIQVVDHETGEDITAVTLTQVMFEREKKSRGSGRSGGRSVLPHNVLSQLIQAGGETLNTLRRSIPLPFNLTPHIDEEIERRVRALGEQGELDADTGENLIQKLLAQSRPLETEPAPKEELEAFLHDQGLPTRDEFEQLLAQIEFLAGEIENMKGQGEG
ncbi:MAG TPA: polyhydroxyalkanoate synthesis regulator DNA-binding domain-containing protein [Anaerolineales bacterium]|nr:polyhydroxyalkanoate synthesis regulator DNA-binding domain-containing protein [Anaerolineales bacterium]